MSTVNMVSRPNNTSGEEGAKPIDILSKDIRSDLEEALEAVQKSCGAWPFAFKRSYKRAPNPRIRLDELGIIGLPLSQREAQVITSHFTRPSGMDEPAPSKNGGCLVPSSQVHLENPDWYSFMSDVVQDVCAALGVAHNAVTTRDHGLSIWEGGSCPRYSQPEVSEELFARIVIVLPSLFVGGSTRLSYEGFASEFHISGGSGIHTSVVAWKNGVDVATMQVTSGYYSSLSVDLVHRHNSPHNPPLSPAILHNLRHILLSWSSKKDYLPIKITILLDRHYPQTTPKACMLKGSDARKVSILDMLAHEHGFRLALANYKIEVEGAAEFNGSENDVHYRKQNQAWDACSDDVYDEDNTCMGEDQDRTITISHAIDLEGNQVLCDTDCEDDDDDDKDSTIPASLASSIESNDHDKEEYCKSRGSWMGTYTRHYQRTVLMIWPNIHNHEIECHESHAAEDLLETLGPTATEEELQLIEYIFETSRQGRSPKSAALESVCTAAIQWNDLELWRRAVGTYPAELRVNTLEEDQLLESVKRFGFNEVRPTFERMLENERNNGARARLLKILSSLPASTERPPTAWITAQRKFIVESLKRPSHDEAPVILAIAHELGGVPILQHMIIPKLKAFNDLEFLKIFALHLNFEREAFSDENGDRRAVDCITTDLLTIVVDGVDFFAPVVQQQPVKPTFHYPRPQPQNEPSPDIAHKCISACLLTGNEHLVTRAIDRLTTTSSTTSSTKDHRLRLVILPQFPLVAQILQTPPSIIPPLLPRLARLCRTLWEIYWDSNGNLKPTINPWAAFLQAVVSEVVLNSLGTEPRIQLPVSRSPNHDPSRMQDDADLLTIGECKYILDHCVTALLSFAILKIDPFAPVGWEQDSGYPRIETFSPEPAGLLLEACRRSGNSSLVADVLEKLSPSPNVQSEIAHRQVKLVLIPLISRVCHIPTPEYDSCPASGKPMQPVNIMQHLCYTALPLFIQQFCGRAPSSKDWVNIMEVIVSGNRAQLKVLDDIVLPNLQQFDSSGNYHLSLVHELQARRKQILESGGSSITLAAAISEAVRQIVLKLELEYVVDTGSRYTEIKTASELRAKIVDTLELCVSTGNLHQCCTLFSRLLQSYLLHPAHVNAILIPLLPEISSLTSRIASSLIQDPWASFCRSVIARGWANTVLGPRPSDNIAMLTSIVQSDWCKCHLCLQVLRFLTSQTLKESLSLPQIGHRNRLHVEDQVFRHARDGAYCETVRAKGPQGVVVWKSDAYLALQRWREERLRGRAIVQSLTPDQRILQELFGRDYEKLSKLL